LDSVFDYTERAGETKAHFLYLFLNLTAQLISFKPWANEKAACSHGVYGLSISSM